MRRLRIHTASSPSAWSSTSYRHLSTPSACSSCMRCASMRCWSGVRVGDSAETSDAVSCSAGIGVRWVGYLIHGIPLHQLAVVGARRCCKRRRMPLPSNPLLESTSWKLIGRFRRARCAWCSTSRSYAKTHLPVYIHSIDESRCSQAAHCITATVKASAPRCPHTLRHRARCKHRQQTNQKHLTHDKPPHLTTDNLFKIPTAACEASFGDTFASKIPSRKFELLGRMSD